MDGYELQLLKMWGRDLIAWAPAVRRLQLETASTNGGDPNRPDKLINLLLRERTIQILVWLYYKHSNGEPPPRVRKLVEKLVEHELDL